MKIAFKVKCALERKNLVALISSCLLMAYSSSSLAFSCKVNSTNVIFSEGQADVHVNLTPSIGVGKNIIVDLSKEISCMNGSTPNSNIDIDYVWLTGGSYGGALDKSLKGTIYWGRNSYPMPLNTQAGVLTIDKTYWHPLPVILYLTPLGTAGGQIIQAGSLIAHIDMTKISRDNPKPNKFRWNIIARNNVVIPTGGCDVSSRNVTVTLPDYPGTAAIPLTVRCAKNQQLAYYLTGSTTDTGNTIFSNSTSPNSATGVGVQLSNRTGVIATNKTISLGTIGSSPVSLGLTASYARTSGQVAAGNVQSIVGVTFKYD